MGSMCARHTHTGSGHGLEFLASVAESYSHLKLKFWRMREVTPFLKSIHN